MEPVKGSKSSHVVETTPPISKAVDTPLNKHEG
jgi:hypothetical protein